MRTPTLLGLLLLVAESLFADQQGPNLPHVVASSFGRCYARSLPASSWGEDGKTSVFWVDAKGDQLVHTYDWYSRQLHVECDPVSPIGAAPISVVRFGPWNNGKRASKDDLAVAFYWQGALVASYSTLDLAGTPENVRPSASHYRVVERVVGYQSLLPSEFRFSLETVDGRTLVFDAVTGKQLKGE